MPIYDVINRNDANGRTSLPIVAGASSLTVYQQIFNQGLSPTALTVEFSSDPQAVSAAFNITVASATALTVARAGTNYALQIDTSASSAVTGIRIRSRATGSRAAIDVLSAGATESLDIDAKGAGEIRLGNISTGQITLGQNTAVSGTTIITSAATNALAVGANGSTNPVLTVNASVASVATGIQLTGNAAGNGVSIAAISSGINEDLVLNSKGSGIINLNNSGTGAVLSNRDLQVLPQSATALIVSRTLANPAFQVNTNTAASVTGVRITAAAAGNRVAVDVLSSGANEGLDIDAKGSGTIRLGQTSTGDIVLVRTTNIGNATLRANLLQVGTVSPTAAINGEFVGIYRNGAIQVGISGAGAGIATTLGITSTRGTHATPTTLLVDDAIGYLTFNGYNDSYRLDIAYIKVAAATGWGATLADTPTYIAFFTTPDGSSTAVEAFRITSAGGLQFADAKNITFNATTGTKIGTAPTEKLAFWNAIPVVQGALIADATGGATVDAEARTAINTLLARMRTYGLIAT